MRTVRTLVLLAALATGCAADRAFRCPASGGAAWREIATDHFVLRTDLDRGEAAALLGRLERQRAAILSALFEGATPAPGRVEVVAFRTGEEYRDVAPAGVDAYYLRSSGGPPRIVMSGELAPWQRALLSHELTHHFLAGAFVRQPRWLSEGLATYLESLADDPRTGTLIVGAAPLARLSRVRWDPVPTREVLRWGGAPQPGAHALYASSWLLVHYLANRHAAAFAGYQARLARGEDPEAAWRAELPEYDPNRRGALEALDRTLAAYASDEVVGTTHAAPAPRAVVGTEQPMPSTEVHALRLALWPQRPDQRTAPLRAEVDEALREDLGHPVALQVLAELQGGDPRPLARAATRAHPDDPRGWTFLAGALDRKEERGEREAAYRRAVELSPDNPAALSNLATALLEDGRSGEALPLARRAAALAPWSPPLLRGYAAVLADLGRCAEAIPVQRRALDVLPEGTAEQAYRDLRDRLADYSEQCRVAAASRPSPAPEHGEGAPEIGRQRGVEDDGGAGPGVVEGKP
jgi:tetratricopeptide (TPR) repeat protein